jgi:peptidyl-prolyl cis-trans isomerase D
MLQKFRERMQGIIAWTIVIAICITFALWGIQNYLHGDSSGNYLAKVNGVKITQKKLLTAYEILRNEKMRQLGADYQFDQASQLE